MFLLGFAAFLVVAVGLAAAAAVVMGLGGVGWD